MRKRVEKSYAAQDGTMFSHPDHAANYEKKLFRKVRSWGVVASGFASDAEVYAAERRFRRAFTVLYCLYHFSKNNHCLTRGCGADTLSYWANDVAAKMGIHHLSPSTYRRALAEAVRRGWAIEGRNAAGCRCYRLVFRGRNSRFCGPEEEDERRECDHDWRLLRVQPSSNKNVADMVYRCAYCGAKGISKIVEIKE